MNPLHERVAADLQRQSDVSKRRACAVAGATTQRYRVRRRTVEAALRRRLREVVLRRGDRQLNGAGGASGRLPGVLAGRMRIRQPNPEHHNGKALREVPFFAPLRPFLEEAWDAAVPGTEYVVAGERYRRCAKRPTGWYHSNLRTQFLRIIRRAGVEPWPRLFHNLRASLATDLTADFPSHVVVDWLGHTEAIAQAHDWQPTTDPFAAASKWSPVTAAHTAAAGAGNDRKRPQTRLFRLPRRVTTYVITR